ncbi:carbohydrate porin [Paraburkholderia tropica]|uniref:carbohydrate porin n=1 Tax=Paraburkholderia tropica TaxID=92647 RepID=UPI002AB16F68|nr:carbohydrate porin [Paraburkholderia tropica]
MKVAKFLLTAAIAAAAQSSMAETSPDVTAQVPLNAMPPVLPADMPNPMMQCGQYADYDKLLPRTAAVLIQTPACETISPTLFGLRSTLADNGFGFSASIRPSYQYDVLGHNEHPQKYNGQNPTYLGAIEMNLTYDLTRLGFGGNAQFVIGATGQASSYHEGNPAFMSMTTLAINQQFYNGQLELQYGYYDLIRDYYGMVLGGQSASAALGPVSVIPVELGLSLFTPTPAATVAIKDSSLSWYNRASIARSASPNGFQYDIDHNPTGFNFTVPGSRAMFVDEFGYKTPVGAPGRSIWARIGGIYNTSPVSDFKSGGMADKNYGGYAALTVQITKPDPFGPQGLYLDTKFDYAPEDRNLFARDFQLTAFYIGPFKSRPLDMVSLGFSTEMFSKYARQAIRDFGGQAERSSTALSLSYAARVTRGIYFVGGLTYQTAPSFTPERSNAFLVQTALNIAF